MTSLRSDNRKRSLKLLSVCGVILALFALTVALAKLKTVLVPLTIAVLFHIMLIPLIDFFSEKIKLPRWLAAGCSLTIGIGLLTLLASTLIYSFNKFSGSISSYKGRINELLRAYGLEAYAESLFRRLDANEMLDIAQAVSKEAVSITGTLSLVLIFLLFLMASSYRSKLNTGVYTEIKTSISRYIWIKFTVSLATALLVGIFFHAIKLELALTFSLLVLLLNFIPNLGSVIATFLPLPIAFLQFGLSADFFLVLLVPGFIQFTIGNIIEPKFMGDSFGIHPIIVLSFLIFWGIVWGAVGMFLAVPILSVIKIISSHIRGLEFISKFLEGNIADILDEELKDNSSSVHPLVKSS